jgi:hypothetical protein
MDQMQVPCLLKKKWDLRERQRSNRPPRRRSRRTENLTQRRKDAKVEGKTGLAATDVAKAMSVKKDGKEREKDCIQ